MLKMGSGVVTGVVVVNSQFLDNNPQAVDAFLTDYQKSANFANENIETAADLIKAWTIQGGGC